jgi:SAM-dependent methyltransferase
VAEDPSSSRPYDAGVGVVDATNEGSTVNGCRGHQVNVPRIPVSEIYGYDRGTPLDRYYIGQFLAANARFIRGAVAEVKDDEYTRTYGAGHVTSTTIIDIDPTNPGATLVVDLTHPASLPAGAFDCILLTQAIQLFADPGRALTNCWQALAPNGTLILTVPACGRLSLLHPAQDYWRITPTGLRRLLLDAWPGPVATTAYGNLSSCVAMLTGYAAEELEAGQLTEHDPAYPLVSCALAHRPPSSA